MIARTRLRTLLAAAALLAAPFVIAACSADSAEEAPAAGTATAEALPEVRYYIISET